MDLTTSGPLGMVSRLRRGGSKAPPNSPVFASWRGGSLGPQLEIQQANISMTNLPLRFTTVTDKSYTVQCAESLNQPSWYELTTMAGDGAQKSVAVSNAVPQRFYRVKVN